MSPDGSAVAFVTGPGERSEIALLPLDSGAERWLPCQPAVRRVSASGGGAIDWLPDGLGLVYVGVDGCIHRIDLDDYECRPLTRWPDAVSSVSVSPAGDELAYVVDMRDVVIVPTDPGSVWPRRISAGADFVLDPAWSPDGRWLAWHEWDDPNMPWDSSRIVVRRSNGDGPIVTVAGDGGVGVQQPRFSPDGGMLSYLCDADGWLNIWAVDVPSFDNARNLAPEEHEQGAPVWGPGQRSYAWLGDDLVYQRNSAGWGSLIRRSLSDRACSELQAATFTGLSARGDHVVGIGTNATEGYTVRLIGGDGDRALAHGPLAGVEQAGVEPESVEWTSTDGFIVHGRLYRAPGGVEPSPLIVWVRGGPTGQSPVTLYRRFGYFLQRGWSILVVDYRGSTGWGRQYTEALNGCWGVGDVADVATGITAAVANGWADAGKVALYGDSAGGYTALLVMARFPELCKAGVVVYPVVDLIDFESSTWRFEAHYIETLIGPLPAAFDLYEERSPMSHAGEIKAPLLLMHGDNDVVVPVRQSQAFVERIRRAGGTVEACFYEGEGHSWRKSSTMADELERAEAFLRRHVLHLGASSEEKT